MKLDLRGVGFLTAIPYKPMASAHWHSQQYLPSAADGPNVFAESFDEAQVEEDRILSLLREAFPGTPLETLAAAYARADRDPNVAAEILSVDPSQQFNPCIQKSERHFVDNGFRNYDVVTTSTVHSDDFRSNSISHQLKNGHGDFAGASVWRDSPILGNHGRLPDSGSDPELSKSISSRLSASAEVYVYKGTNTIWPQVNVPDRPVPATKSDNVWSNSEVNQHASDGPKFRLKATPKSVSPVTHKLSAVTGSVSSQRLRRIDRPNGTGSKGTVESHMVLDEGLYSGTIRERKKKVGPENRSEITKVEADANQRAAEDFLHSMLGGDIGIDVVRDVLGHYEGDTDKALETLLHIGSTSSGYYNNSADKHADPVGTGDVSQLLSRLHETFPKVERTSLAVVLEAADFSYEETVKILQDAGMVPFSRQIQEKLDPSDVLQALFTTDPQSEEKPELSSGPQASQESWTVVAAKARVRRNPDVEAVTDTITCQTNGAWNDYTRHRASANEHWATMKNYMKEAAAAHGRGERALAGVLSEKGAEFKRLALEASNRASQNIFNVRNKDIENNITIDLHSQHVIESLRLLKLHLRSLSQIPSVQRLTVITGQGSHSTGGRAKVKPALTRYLQKKQISWKEPNPGCIEISMSDVRGLEVNHRSSDSSSEQETQ